MTIGCHALYVLVASTGIREGEALGLSWSDVDLGGQTVTIRRQQPRHTGQGFVHQDVKTAKGRRVIPLTDSATDALGVHKDRLSGQRRAAGLELMDSGRVFPSEVRPLDPANLRRRFKAALSRTGLPEVTIHELRHTATSWMAAEGIPMHLIQAVLGHANSSTTQDIYTHVLATDLNLVRERMNEAFRRPDLRVMDTPI